VANRLYNPPVASVTEYLHMLDTLGVERGVLVQPSVYGTDNRALLDGLAQAQGRLRGVAVLPYDVSADEVRHLHRMGVRGVRCNIVDLKQGKGQLPLAGLQQLARTIAALGWHLEFLMHVNEFPDLHRQMRTLPVPLVFGHLGYVPTSEGGSEGFEGLLDLARAGQAWIKMTAPYRLTPESSPYASVAPVARLLCQQVPDRLLWGSDWPHVFIKTPMPNDGDLLDLMGSWMNSSADLHAIWVDHPKHLYGR
jgi:predicted TIM-barrel fold metal-dependent hydrolase